MEFIHVDQKIYVNFTIIYLCNVFSSTKCGRHDTFRSPAHIVLRILVEKYFYMQCIA